MAYSVRGTLLLALTLACFGQRRDDGLEPEETWIWRNADVRGEASPAVGSFAVYHLEQETHVLTAVRKADGTVIWRRKLPVSNPQSDGYGLAIADGVLIVGDLDLFGIDPRTGNTLWKFQPEEGANPGFGRLSVSNGVVYCGSTSGHVFAVDAATGIERWAVRAMPSTSSIYNPVIVDGILYVGFTSFSRDKPAARGGAIALEASSGRLIWRAFAPVADPGAGTENTDGVAVIGSRVFFGSPVGVHVVDRSTGALVTTLRATFFDDSPMTPHRPFAAGPVLLVASGSPAHVTAVDPRTLDRKWQHETASSVASLSWEGELAYIPQFDRLVAVNLHTGVTAWTFRSPVARPRMEWFLAAPAIDDSVVFLPGSMSVYALRGQ